MRPITILLFTLLLTVSCDRNSNADVTAEIVALERSALDRWGKGDPQGYIELFAPEVTYFDPLVDQRVDGLPAMRGYLVPLTGKIKVDHFEMLSPKVQRHGPVALLTFNLLSYGNANTVVARWNSTETYAQFEGKWKIVHSHWSFVKPELKLPIPG